MMKKLLLGLVAAFVAGSASAQLDFNAQTVKANKMAETPSLLSNVLGSKSTATKADSKFKTHSQWIKSTGMTQQVRKNMSLMSASAAKVAKAEKAATNALTWFSYINSNNLTVIGFGDFTADWLQSQTKYNVACMVPSNYEKAKIDSVEFYVLSGCTYDNVKVWASPVKFVEDEEGAYIDVPDSAEKAETMIEVSASEVNKVLSSLPQNYVGPISVKLPKSITIPADGAIVGYSFDGKSGESPVVLAGTATTDESLLFQYEYDGKRYFEALGTTMGMNSTIMVGMDVADCEANSATVEADPEITTLTNTKGSYGFYITNNSAKPITEISYILSYDNEDAEEKTMTLNSPIEALETATIPAAATFAEEGMHSITLAVTKVNGNENLADETEATNTIIALEKGAERVNVVEEMTGTWCGWCPRGHVALANLNKDLGDKVITLAGHYSGNSADPMNCYNLTESSTMQEAYMDYGYILSAVSSMLGGGGFPGAVFNRMIWADPYIGATDSYNERGTIDYGATKLVNLIDQTFPSEADFSMTASWADESKEAINVDLTTAFKYDRFGEFPYGVAFVLSENGMTGKSASWKQVNYFNKVAKKDGASDYNNPDMASWFSASYNASCVYDNVVVQSWAPLGMLAITESENDDITKDEEIKYNNVLTVNSKIIQDKEQLVLSALLVNLNSLAVVNAAKVFIGSAAAGIQDVNNVKAGEVSRYNVNGMRLNGAQKGLNIVKLADGKVVKMAVNK